MRSNSLTNDSVPLATVMISRQNLDTKNGQQWLVQLHPLDIEQGKIELTEKPMIIGRQEESDIHLEDDSVSREHARIEWSPTGYTITDLGSTNGVLVNDAAVESAPLATGDRIQLGQRIFRFLVDNDKESQYYETVYTMMTRDGLTGAFNKRYLLECLERDVTRSRKFNRPISVILFDIDHFKSVNDTYGHLAGDEVLREIAVRIQTQVDSGFFARFGGEEFAVVAVETRLEEAASLAEDCRAIVAATPFQTSAGPLDITISLGVASPDSTTLQNADSILSAADSRLYEAKRGGRNQVVAR